MSICFRSRPGHILGDVTRRPDEALAERDLDPLSCASLRLIVHLSIYLSTLLSPEKVQIQTSVHLSVALVHKFSHAQSRCNFYVIKFSWNLKIHSVMTWAQFMQCLVEYGLHYTVWSNVASTCSYTTIIVAFSAWAIW